MSEVKSLIPVGFHTVSPYLMVQNAEGLVDFMKKVFGATETHRSIGSAGGLHIEVRIGDSMLMIGGVWEGQQYPAALYLYLDEVDAVYRRALEAGATSLSEPADQSYGDRYAGVRDAFGNTWFIATHLGDK